MVTSRRKDRSSLSHTLAALVNLNHPGHYINWGFIQISVANAIVIGLMILVFVLALVLPFPHGRAITRARTDDGDSGAIDEHSEARPEP
jgi:hypothetical protein